MPRAHGTSQILLPAVLLALPGCVSEETRAEVVAVEFQTVPTVAEPGEPFDVCWRVQGIGRIAHTDLHLLNHSHELDPSATVDPGPHRGTPVPPGQEGATDYDLPGTFCSELRMPDEGSLFIVAHAAGPEHHRVSAEAVVSPAT